jgi:hypothetical protein
MGRRMLVSEDKGRKGSMMSFSSRNYFFITFNNFLPIFFSVLFCFWNSYQLNDRIFVAISYPILVPILLFFSTFGGTGA